MIKWEERYSIGDGDIDRQHKAMFDMFNDFESFIKEDRGESYLEKYFPLLDAYAQAHFKHEESIMEKYQCPSLQENIEAHRLFLANIADFKKQYKLAKKDSRLLMAQVHGFIEVWIVEHIIGVDSHLKDCIKNKKGQK
jgi:hemerythrin